MSSTHRSSVATFAGRAVEVRIERSARARRLTLRADAVRGVVRVALPARGRLGDAEKFIAAHDGWIAARVATWPVAVPFAPGAAIPFDGTSLWIDWSSSHPRGVKRDGERLIIGGPEATVPGRTLRWLRAAALADMATATHAIAALIDRQVTGIAVRDPAGRWGSCSSSGAIGYSWRLILAPPAVRQSVVAHEVAHLVHPNHGRDFWQLAKDLTDGDIKAARAWLATNGAALHWVGRAA
ncbi:M48 family metallopeptidase [Glacieibacterium megasporae]|uniref:M48 family metallopeptidase n=1 Tax=Glacieibacterium megasporae TaxID=2835787 RepID=UPI001C1E5E79|nr:YgjP-like metallopeptidase domain-containing protein [Polymorphobacter megasporae]UAJ10896.1 M48 family metallopeptidase [Polymorphobacter megasporae]